MKLNIGQLVILSKDDKVLCKIIQIVESNGRVVLLICEIQGDLASRFLFYPYEVKPYSD